MVRFPPVTERLPHRIRAQIAEAHGPVNRWYCAQFYRREISDLELLMRYFIRSGGAADFDRRYREAMSLENRWFCSEFHRRDVREEPVLWSYYMTTLEIRARAIAC